MQRIMLRSKIHRATLTGTELDYEGSIAIDRDLIAAADLLPGEQVHVLNLNNGQRLVKYVMCGAPARDGAAERPCRPAGRPRRQGGDLGLLRVEAEEAAILRPTVVYVDKHNRPIAK